VATRRDNFYILTGELTMFKKLFDINRENGEFSIFHHGKRTGLGKLVGVDLSPEALIESLDIREGDRLLLVMATRGRAVGSSTGS